MSGLLNVDDLSPEEQLQAAMGVHPAQLSVQNHIKGIPSAMDSVGGPPANGFVGNNENPLNPRTLKTVQPPTPSIAGPSMPGERPAANLPGVTIPKPSPVAQDLNAAQTEKNRLLTTGSGVSQVGGGHGFMHGLARVADIAGSVLAPGVMGLIPGTELHHGLLLNNQNNRISNDIGQQKQQADIGKTNAETNKLNTPDEPTPDKAIHTYVSDQGKETTIFQKPDGTTYEKAFGAVQSKPDKPDTANEVKQNFMKIIAKAAPGGQVDPNVMTDVKKLTNLVAHSPNLTPQEREQAISYLVANPTPAASGSNVIIKEAGADRRQENSFNDKDVQATHKRYETALDADQRLSRMEAAYGKAKTGDQQAMLSLLTDHIGMTLGLQKGARITKDILNEATQSQPWLSKIASKFDDRGYLSGVTLGPQQMEQMLDLGYEARDRSVQGAHDASTLYGVEAPKGAEAVFGKRQVGQKPALTPQGQGPAGTIHYVEGSGEYDIPPDKEAAFKAKHPSAVRR